MLFIRKKSASGTAGLKPFTNVVPLNSATLAAPFLLGGYATPVLRRQLAEALARVSPAVIRARLRAVIDIDVTENLQRVRAPLLYLRASRDRLVSEASARLIAALAPQTETVVVDGPHMLLQTAPVIAANPVGQFIARTDP